MQKTTIETRFVIETLFHGAFGNAGDKWICCDHNRYLDDDLKERFQNRPDDEKIAAAVLSKVAGKCAGESFRLVRKTTIIVEDIRDAQEPIEPYTVADIEKLLKGLPTGRKHTSEKNPVSDNRFRLSNEIVPVIRELNINPWRMGGYEVHVIEEAVRQYRAGKFEDAWIALYQPRAGPTMECEYNRAHSFINLAKQVMIEADMRGVGTDKKQIYLRYDYSGSFRPASTAYLSLSEAKAGKHTMKNVKTRKSARRAAGG